MSNLISRFCIFESAVNNYNLNPTANEAAEDVKKAYTDYISSKKEMDAPKELLDRESDLIKDIGGLLK